MKRRRLMLVGVLGLVLLPGVGYLAYTQIFGPQGAQMPEFGVEDMDD